MVIVDNVGLIRKIPVFDVIQLNVSLYLPISNSLSPVISFALIDLM